MGFVGRMLLGLCSGKCAGGGDQCQCVFETFHGSGGARWVEEEKKK
jgi:hypothetical protein